MRKIVIALLGIVAVVGLSVSPVLAGAVINKSNMSADYFRSLTRHASMDAADIIAFNPAGVMEMKDGFYTKLDVMYIEKDYTNDVPGLGTLESDEPSTIPGVFLLYKKERWAGFFAVTVPGGGGEVQYDQGNARTTILAQGVIASATIPSPPAPIPGIPAFNTIVSQELEGDSYDIGYTLGGAFKVNNFLSLSGGVRYIDATQEFDGNVVLDGNAGPRQFNVELERDADGWGFFLGANIKPVSKLNIGILFQSNTELDFESDVSEDDIGVTPLLGWADGTKQREDLPGLIGVGVGYQFTPKFRTEVAYTRYLEDAATLEGSRFDDIGDSWEIGVSLTYAFSPKFRASIGYLHTDIQGMDAFQLLAEAPELDAQTIGFGGVFSPTPNWDITFGITHVNYDDVITDARSVAAGRAPEGTEYDKTVRAISFGVQYRWF